MKRIYKLDIKQVLLYSGLIVVLFLSACMYLRSVSMPDHGTANKVSTFTMHCWSNPFITETGYAQEQLVIGFLAPKGWHVAENTSVTYTSNMGDGVMTLMPADVKEKITGLVWPDAAKKKLGIGGNLVDDVEWVIYQSDRVITAHNMDTIHYDVSLNVKLGPDNMLVKLGFFNAEMADGFSPPFDGKNPYYATYFSDCFSVIGGSGDIVDFCNPQLSAISPVKGLDNDIFTFNYDNRLLSTSLSNMNDIYLCGTAYTTDGEVYKVCEQTPKTRLTPLSGQKYRIDLWPRGFFGVDKNKTLARIEYYYTDVSGTLKVGYANTSDPFKFTFTCPN